MKLILPKSHIFGPVYIDDEDKLGLGPADFVLLGHRHIAGYIDGRITVTELPPKDRRRSKRGGSK